MPKIAPFLWFDDQVEEAVNFYVSLFDNSKILSSSDFGSGKIMSMTFQLEGQEFMALNGGPTYKFTPAISLFVKCQSQAEVDFFWEKFTRDGGEEQPCGWVRDRFGLSWQIIPDDLGRYLGDPDPAKASRAMQAMLKMKKIDVEALKMAHVG